MARPYRLQGANCLYHIMSRGDDRKKVYTEPGDNGKFIDYVVKAKEHYQNDSFEFRGLTPSKFLKYTDKTALVCYLFRIAIYSGYRSRHSKELRRKPKGRKVQVKKLLYS